MRPCSHPSASWASPAPVFPGLAMEVGLAFGGLSRAEKRRGERRAGRAGARAKRERWAPRGGAQRSLPAPWEGGEGLAEGPSGGVWPNCRQWRRRAGAWVEQGRLLATLEAAGAGEAALAGVGRGLL